jgi:hypothetical protein
VRYSDTSCRTDLETIYAGSASMDQETYGARTFRKMNGSETLKREYLHIFPSPAENSSNYAVGILPILALST